MKKRIGVTGASGFIGKLLIEQLLHEGYSVKALVRSKNALSSGVKIIHGDLTNAKIVDLFLNDIDILIHLAGRQIEPEKKLFHDNVSATDILLSRAIHFPIKHVIFLSTAAVYADKEKKMHTETENCYPSTYYGMTKYLAEKICQYWQTLSGQKLTILRPFNVYGKESRKGVVFNMIESIKKTNSITIYGDGSQSRDFLYGDDLVKAILIVIQKEQEGIFNLGSGEKVTIRELANKIKRLTPYPVQIYYKKSETGKTKEISYSLKNIYVKLKWKAQTKIEEGLRSIL